MQVLKTEKAKNPNSWPSRLEGLQVGKTLPVSIESSTTVRQCISRLKQITEMDFTTATIDGVVVVTRTA